MGAVKPPVRILCLLPLLLLAGWRAPHERAPRREVRELLGTLFDGAKLVAVRNSTDIVTIDLNSLKPRSLGAYERKGRFDGLGRPSWSPDGRQLLFGYDRKCFLMNADGTNKRRILRNQPTLYDPKFWSDPETDELCVVFIDRKLKNGLERGKWGNTFRTRLRTAETEHLFDIPCDAGLSADGRYLGETYRHAAIVDLVTEQIYRPHAGQSCNSSMRPVGDPDMMFLYIPHSRFGIKNRFGKEIWSIRKPDDGREWQAPRWSNHPDYCAAVAKFKAGYKIVLIHIPTKKTVILESLEGNWTSPHLWLAGAGQRNKPATVASQEQAGRSLDEADGMTDAGQAKAVYEEIAEQFAGRPLAERARAALHSPQLRKELDALPALHELWMLADRLRPAAVGSRSRYDDSAYFDRNRALLIRMAGLCATLRNDHPGTKAAVQATNTTRQYALPEQPPPFDPRTLELTATIEAVSRIPTPEQIAPYREVVTFIRYRVDKVISGAYDHARIVVAHWGMKDARPTEAAQWRPGTRQRLKTDLFDSHPELDRITQAADAHSAALEPYWALDVQAVRTR